MSSDDIRDLRRRHRQAVARSLHGGLRPRLRLRRARADDAPALPLAPLQRPRRRVRRQPREPRAPAARGARGHARGVRRPRRRRLPDRRRRAARRRGHRAAPRSRSCSGSSASCRISGTSWSASGRTTRSRRASAQEAWTEEHFRGLKQLTSKPVVGVGRLTSPDTMVRLVRDGVLDLIGAARPSIADPFLPQKIEEGRLEDIRECIGCNVCVTGDWTATPIRCTQNPSMGEEWRRGWHPERIRPSGSDAKVLVVGARPGGARGGDDARQARLRGRARRGDARARWAGAARGAAAGARGVDPGRRLPPRAAGEAAERRPGARERGRRPTRCSSTASRTSPSRPARAGARDGVGPLAHARAAAGSRDVEIAHPRRPARRRTARTASASSSSTTTTTTSAACSPSCSPREGRSVTLVTPAPRVSEWTVNTMEHPRIHRRLVERGVALETAHALHVWQALRASCASTRGASASSLRRRRARDGPPAGRRARRGAAARRAEWARRGSSVRASATPGRRARSRRPCGTAGATPRSSTAGSRRRGAVPPRGRGARGGGTVSTWIVLALAIVAEVIGTTALRASTA